MTPYFEDTESGIVLHLGDCVEVMAAMDENSVDSIVTDPPYGLEFMGKEWDTLGEPEGFRRKKNGADVGRENVFGRTSRTSPEYVAGSQMQAWHHAWAVEALRVLKPGGHLLAFGGTRTSHRLVCALEDAGFEIRDCLGWIYGSGFPKSLDVSKAIDRAAGAEREVVGYRSPFPPDHPRPNKDFASMAKVRKGKSGQPGSDGKKLTSKGIPIEAPATEAAKQWDGWGTALKPAWEPVLLCTKPLTVQLLFGIFIGEITNKMKRGMRCCGLSASDVETSFSAIQARLERAQVFTVPELVRTNAVEKFENAKYVASLFTSNAPESNESIKTKENSVQSHAKQSGNLSITSERLTRAGVAENISASIRAISISVMEGDTLESIASSWNSTSVDLLNQLNKFTIRTAISLIIELKTLRSWMLPNTSDDTGNLSPNAEPIILCRKPLSESTVAANVLRWGTGALNIDACRIETSDGYATNAVTQGVNTARTSWEPRQERRTFAPSLSGRFPANLILDGSDEVLSLFPETRARGNQTPTNCRGNSIFGLGDRGATTPINPGDSGSAARFFYVAKSAQNERFIHLYCNCETVKLEAWEKQDPSQNDQTDGRSPPRATSASVLQADMFCNTFTIGNGLTVRSPKDIISTTKTKRSGTTGSTISNSSPPPNTNGSTQGALSETAYGGSRAEYVVTINQSQQSSGIYLPKDGRSTGVVVPAILASWFNKSVCANCGSEVKSEGHPTQKPVALIRYLIRLITPPGGLVLDPFVGSGTTLVAAEAEGFRCIGIEKEKSYCEIAVRRLKRTDNRHHP